MPETQPDRPHVPYRQGQLIYEVKGAPWRPWSDLYFQLMRAPAWQLVLWSLAAYVAAIGGFAVLYRLGGDCIAGARSGSWADAFWFSVQTFSTIGYGGMSPSTPYANVLVTLESWLGLSGVAVGTALLFSKFARPTARIQFAPVMVLCRHNGLWSLQFRLANERTAGLVDAEAAAFVMMRETTKEGQRLLRIRRLTLDREEIPHFGMLFTGIHEIGPDSPIADWADDPDAVDVLGFRVQLRGVDLSMLQPVWAMEVFPVSQVRRGHRFVDAVSLIDGTPTLDLRNIPRTVPDE